MKNGAPRPGWGVYAITSWDYITGGESGEGGKWGEKLVAVVYMTSVVLAGDERGIVCLADNGVN